MIASVPAPPAAAPSPVLIMICGTWSVIAIVLPPLNPNQPTHRISTPNAEIGRLCP